MDAPEYARMRALEDAYWWFVARRGLALDLLARFDRTADASGRLLDLGCGTGALLAEWGPPAAGVDASRTALAFCRERGLTGLARGDAAALPYRDASFDLVSALDVVEHLDDDRAALAEAARVLRPGGALVLSVPAYRWLWSPHDVALHHRRRYTRAEVDALLRGAGLTPARLSYAVFLLFPLVLVSRVVEKLRRGPARASLPPVPPWLGRALVRLMRLEAAWVVRGARLPWGSSVVAVAVKPPAASLNG